MMTVIRVLGFGILGGVLALVLTFFAVLALSHLLNPACGTPGDSGGCEMGAATLAVAAMLPGALAGVGWGLWHRPRR